MRLCNFSPAALVPHLDRKLHRRRKPMKRPLALALGLVLGFSATAAFAQRADRNVDLPIVRSLNWFGFVAGDDIRAACTPGSRDRIRLVYNALWEEQVRTYEINLQADGTAGLNIGVLVDQGNVSSVTIAAGEDAL